MEAEALGGQRRHLAHGVLQPQHPQLAHVARQHAGVVAVAAGVRHAHAQLADAAVGREHVVRVREDAPHVVLADGVEHHAGAAAGDEVEGRLDLGLPALVAGPQDARDLEEVLAVERRVGAEAGHAGVAHVLAPLRVAPLADQLAHHAAADLRITQALVHLRGGPVGHPFGQDRVQAGAGRRVDVLVDGHVLAALAGLLHHGDGAVALAVQLGGDDLEVGDLHRQAGLLAHGQRLVDGLDHLGPLVAHVRGVEPLVGGHHAGQFHDLLRLGVGVRHVDEAGGDADRAVAHGRVHDVAHGLHLGGRRVARRVAHHPAPHGAVAHEGGHVHAHAALGHGGERVGQVQVAAAAVARDDARHAHAHEVLGLGALLEVALAVGVHVDEARGHIAPGGVELALGGGGGVQRADGGDAAVLHGQVAAVPRVARAVDDAAVADDHVVAGGGRRRGGVGGAAAVLRGPRERGGEREGRRQGGKTEHFHAGESRHPAARNASMEMWRGGGGLGSITSALTGSSLIA